MININELTLYYIQVTFQPELQKVIYTSFSIMEMFGLKFYEDKYTSLIQRDDTLTSDDKRDMFMRSLRLDVNSIIDSHGIVIDTDADVSLNDVNEIAHFLYIVQKLEDYSDVSYRLYALDTPKNIITDLIQSLTLMSKSRLMDIIAVVSPNLVESLKQFVSDKEEDNESEDTVDMKHRKYAQAFLEFIGDHECLGRTYFESGYTNVTLEELTNLVPYTLSDAIDKKIITDPSQAALDVLSVLFVTKDNYTLPLIKFSKFNHLFTNKLENVTKLQGVMLKMLNDFNMHMEVLKQKEQVND